MTIVRYRKNTGGFARYPQSFTRHDLHRLGLLLDGADAVVPLRESYDAPAGTVAIRHDVDHNLEHAVRFAEWEAKRGYRASYFVLPDAWYARDRQYASQLRQLVELGHEVGLHSNVCGIAYAEGTLTAVDGSALPVGFCERPAEIMREQLAGLRDLGLDIVGCAAHGAGIPGINLGLWTAGYSPQDFGLEYEAYHLHRKAFYATDNRGSWRTSDGPASAIELSSTLATHILMHPCHWDLP